MIRKIIAVLIFMLGSVVSGISQQTEPNMLMSILDSVGVKTEGLGITPKASWTRFPYDVKYVHPWFYNYYENPLDLYDFVKIKSVELEPLIKFEEFTASERILSKIYYYLGASLQTSGFRGFLPEPLRVKEGVDLLTVIDEVNRTGEVLDKKISKKTKIKHEVEKLPVVLHKPLSDLLMGFVKAFQYRQLAIRNIHEEKTEALIESIYLNLVYTVNDKNFHLFEDVKKGYDENSMIYSAFLVTTACDNFIDNVNNLKHEIANEPAFLFCVDTGFGKLVLSNKNKDTYGDDDYFLIVDFLGDDKYMSSCATSGWERPFSIVLDFEGDDVYKSSLNDKSSQGAGIFGTGFLIDMAGCDTYSAVNYSQGFGLFGSGLLFDFEGDDRYVMQNSGQGCGKFGIGVHVDFWGDDQFYIYGDGQGMAGVNGTGVLCNIGGVDKYIAEQDPGKCPYRKDYHSKGEVAFNYAQGASRGRRGDTADGHSYGSGFGLLIDLLGDDSYLSGNFSQGLGYWFGTGILYDRSGIDTYNSVYFTQASAAHFANGVLIDSDGDDKHILEKTSGASLAFGWDFCNSLFVDEKGNDEYIVKQFSLANSMYRSNTFFFELGGNDVYKTFNDSAFYGVFDITEEYITFNKRFDFYDANQNAVFIDLEGQDQYLLSGKKNKWLRHSIMKNDTTWHRGGDFSNQGVMIDAQ